MARLGSDKATRLTVSYSLAHLGKTLIWSFFSTFFLFFAVFGLEIEPLLAGSMILLFAAVDAASDIPAAFLIARSFERFGGMRKWVVIATPFTGCCLVICFALFSNAGNTEVLTIAIGAGIAFRIAFTFLDVPLNASIGRFTSDSRMRNIIAGGRSLAGTVANLLLATLTAVAIEESGQIQSERLWIAALIVALVGSVVIIPSFWHIDKKAAEGRHLLAPDTITENLALTRAGMTKNLVALTIVNVTFILLTPQFSRALIFLIDGAKDTNVSYSSVWLILTIGSALTVWFWVWLASRMSKQAAAAISLALVGLATGLFPLASTHTVSLVLVIALFAAVSHVNTIIWSMLPDAADELSAKVGAQMHAPVIGVFSAIGKLAIGISQCIGGLLLTLSGYPANPDAQFLETSSVCLTILGCALTIVLLFRVGLSHSSHQQHKVASQTPTSQSPPVR